MAPFKHLYAERAWFEFEKKNSAGYRAVRLIVKASIPVCRTSTGYQVSNFTNLENAAIAHAKRYGVDAVVFHSEN